MTPTHPSEQTESLTHQKEKALKEFTTIADTVQTIFEFPPVDQYTTIDWVPTELNLTGPRFGANEYRNIKNQLGLNLSEELLTKYRKYLKPIFWREAFLLYLPHSIRQVSQVADLGLYCYYRYAIKTQKQRHQFILLWEAVSPPIEYTTYRYYPTAGFVFFDNVADGSFLEKAIHWFHPFRNLSTPMTTEAYTANLERWMFNYHRLLRPIELKVLCGLYNCLNCSQTELAEQIRLRQPTVSQTIKRLAEKHLLRLIKFENYGVIGLQPLTVQLNTDNFSIQNILKRQIAKIRYTLSIHELDDCLLISFLIPSERVSRFRQWLKQLAASFDLDFPKIRKLTERTRSQNFELYKPRQNGWQFDYESILDNIYRLIQEELSKHLPPIHSFKLTSSKATKSITLQPQDFTYMQRATDAYLVTTRPRFYEAYEARAAGYKESEHMSYRRRVEFLEKHHTMSPSIGIGIIHIGLNAAVSVLLECSLEETQRILGAFQLFPEVIGRIYEDGSGIVTILVPESSVVSIQVSLKDFFSTANISAQTAIKPTWEAFGWLPVPVNTTNYDFKKGRWIWVKDTLPIIKNSFR